MSNNVALKEGTYLRTWPTPMVLVCGALLLSLAAFACDGGEGDDGVSTSTPVSSPTAAQSAFDEQLAARLQGVLDAAIDDPASAFPGAILRVSSDELGTWTGSAGIGDVLGQTPMRTGDRFRAGSIIKPFVAIVILQLVEEGELSLDDTLPEVLPEDVYSRFPDAAQITIRMLLNHSSGLPEWLGPSVYAQITADPGRVWNVTEFLEISAAQPPNFPPGTNYTYSNTDYNLLGEIIERVTGDSWRNQVTERVIRAVGLDNTLLPEPGDVAMPEPFAHGYAGMGENPLDLTNVDPSMAGAAGGAALVSDLADLVRFWQAVAAGDLFESAATLDEMFTFIDAIDEGGLVGYALGVEKYLLPGGVELVGHLGGAPGYRSFVGYLPAQGIHIAAAMNTQSDPTPVLLPAVEVLTAGPAE
jgi:D-alanyl-D-alanine carboxypeptidase